MIPNDLSPVWISLRTSAAATVIAFVCGLAAARMLSRYRGRWRGLIDGVLILPLVLPPTVIGFFLLLLFGRRSPLGQALEHLGILIAFSWPATVIAAAVVAFPLMYRTALGAFEQVNRNLLDAARTLGASEWRVFSRVLVPLAWPGIMAGTVLAFARALGEFGATLMVAGNIPGRTETMPIAIFFAAEAGDMKQALGWVLLIVALSLAILAGLNYWWPLNGAAARQGRRAGAMVRETPVSAHLAAPARLRKLESVATYGSVLEMDVAKRLGDFDWAVKQTVRAGTTGLLGASGSGKSLTLRCIAGLETPDRGRMVLNGRVLFDSERGLCARPAERRAGFVFQDYALFPHLTVAENIGFGLLGRSEPERRARVAEWAEIVQMTGLLERFPGELSGGQRQRVALARALALEPEVLLLDEPLSALDPHLRRQVEEELRDILSRFNGITLFVTHDRDEAFRFCEELVVLDCGRVVASGPKLGLFDDPGTFTAARVTGCKNLARAQAIGPDEVRVEAWGGCRLRLSGEAPAGMAYVGIRAHDIAFVREAGAENTFPCWVVTTVESPFEVSLYLRLHAAPEKGDCPHLEAEIARERWRELCTIPQPWYARLAPERILKLRP